MKMKSNSRYSKKNRLFRIFIAIISFLLVGRAAFAIIEIDVSDYTNKQKQQWLEEQKNIQTADTELYDVPTQAQNASAENKTEQKIQIQPAQTAETAPECNCDDLTNPDNKNPENFFYKEGQKYRLKPYCKCKPGAIAVQPIASPATDTQRQKEEKTYQWDIHY